MERVPTRIRKISLTSKLIIGLPIIRQLSVKYAERRDNSHSFNCFGNAADPCTGGPVQEHDHLAAINFLQTLSPTLVLNLAYGFTRGAVNEPGITGDYPKIDPVADLGMPSYMDVSGFRQYPAITISGYNSAAGSNIGTQTFSIIKEGQETHQFAGAIDWVRGRHELKFGGRARAPHQLYPTGIARWAV